MQLALDEARAAALREEAPIGAVVVVNGAVVARAGNRTRELHDPTAHAEMLALREAAHNLSAERLAEADLYVTLEPCTMCAGAISHARIRRLYFGAADEKGGAVTSGVRFFNQPSCLHRPEVYSDISGEESAGLLRDFFRARRI